MDLTLASRRLGVIWATLVFVGVAGPANAQFNFMRGGQDHSEGRGQGQSGGFNWGGLIQGAETAIGNAIIDGYRQSIRDGMSNYTPNSQPQYPYPTNNYTPQNPYPTNYVPPVQPYYQSQYAPPAQAPAPAYVAPAPAPAAAPAPKRVAAPRNTVPPVVKKVTAPRNKSALKIKAASLSLTGAEHAQLNKKVKDETKSLQSEASKAGLATLDVAKDTVGAAEKLKATPDQVDELKAAIKVGDEDRVAGIFSDLGMSANDAEAMGAKVHASHALKEYEDELKSSGSGASLEDARQNAQDALGDLADANALSTNPDKKLDKSLPDLSARVDDLSVLSLARDSINTGPGGPGTLDWTQGTVTVINDPRLPNGALFAAGPNTVIMGVGSSGQLDVRTGTASELGIPIIIAEPVPDTEGSTGPSSDSRIVISNPEPSTSSVGFTLDGRYTYTMEPGQTQNLSATRTWLIEFDRGGNFGSARYTLSEGTYEFVAGDQGWNLNRKSFRVELDNRANPSPFSFVMNNKVEVVKAGQSRTLTSPSAILLEFDQGDGGEPARKELASGHYRVGVDPMTSKLDLFPGADETDLARFTGN